MRRALQLIFLLLPRLLTAQIVYSDYFTDQSLRFDFILIGNAEEINVIPQQMKQEALWSGSESQLIDPFDYGSFRFSLIDSGEKITLFSRGFNTLFQEWQTTDEAKHVERGFYQGVKFPFPRDLVTLKIELRQRDGDFISIFEMQIDPNDHFILRETPFPYQSVQIINSGDPSKMVDLVILAEGYTEDEMDKFVNDATRLTNYLFKTEPFNRYKHCFNVTALLTPSLESGTDVPGEGIYKNTIFNSTFYTFDIDRYLTSSDMRSIYDAAAVVPYDQIYLLVNSSRYGGGGVYNMINVCTSDNRLSREVFVHEFGHGFSGLGDEYYTSEVAYNDFYNLNIEPWEPNLTTLVDFESKWKQMVADTTKIPTPRHPDYKNTIGVYEGGGYLFKGIYSPFMNCRMKSNYSEFCPVCSDAIQRMINFYCN